MESEASKDVWVAWRGNETETAAFFFRDHSCFKGECSAMDVLDDKDSCALSLITSILCFAYTLTIDIHFKCPLF